MPETEGKTLEDIETHFIERRKRSKVNIDKKSQILEWRRDDTIKIDFKITNSLESWWVFPTISLVGRVDRMNFNEFVPR